MCKLDLLNKIFPATKNKISPLKLIKKQYLCQKLYQLIVKD